MENKKIIERVNELESAVNILRRTSFSSSDNSGLKKAEKNMIWLIGTLSRNGPVLPSEIAKTVGITLGAITHHLNSLEDQEYILRSTSSDDRRNTLISLSPKGKTMFEKIKKYKWEKLSKMVEFLGEEDTRELISLITKITQFMEQTHD